MRSAPSDADRLMLAGGAVGAVTRVGTAVAGGEDDDVAAAAVEDDRLDDLGELAAGGARSVSGGRRPDRELLEPRLGARLAEEGGDALHGLGPRHAGERRRNRMR